MKQKPRCATFQLDFTRDKPSPLYVSILKKVCNSCPVQQVCLDQAIANNEEAGIWGGMTLLERGRYKYERMQMQTL